MNNKITYETEEELLKKTSRIIMLPSIYNLINLQGNGPATFLNIIASLISYNFWKNPRKGFRRNLDLLYQPLFGSYMYFLGTIYSNNILLLVLGNIFFLTGLSCYNKSCIEYRKYNRFWYIYHGIFHTCMTISCFIVHNSVKK
tara:strand:- start:418 stop:846 length:429 start_codon:yes stop_codon:yes gene_type:complete